jgi:monothiol glutaredoxin
LHGERIGFGAAEFSPLPSKDENVHRSVHRQRGQRKRGGAVHEGHAAVSDSGFSGQVVQILDNLGVAYKGLNVLENEELRQGIKTYSNWPTIPQLYVKGEFVGGCDIIREMFQSGELQSLLKHKGVATKAPATA